MALSFPLASTPETLSSPSVYFQFMPGNWIEELTEAVRGNIQILLVGTKCDLVEQREVEREEA